jgi:hypothetical protein
MFQAAAALLGAADPAEIKVRKHSGDPKAVGALVKAIEDCIANPALLLPGYDPEKAADDQLKVIAFVRRQAVRALAQVKFATLPGPDGKTPMYPAYTLVRIAMDDPALVPVPSPGECAEAILGLCNMQPPAKGYNADVAVEAVVAGMITFATPRAANVTDRSLPWRSYALRMAEALRNWRPMFDPDFDVLQPTKYDASRIPPSLEEFFNEVVPKVLAPIEKVDFSGKADSTAQVKIEVVRDRLKKFRANPMRSTTLFAGVPATSVEFAVMK